MNSILDIPSLATRLGSSPDELFRLVADAPLHYRRVYLAKLNEDKTPKTKDGRVVRRPIDASLDPLKTVQKRLKRLLAEIPLSPSVYGVKGKGHIAHTRRHQGKPYHLKTDLKDFFPSISKKAVARALVCTGVPHDVAHLVAGLATLNGRVPQGAPTSSHISNIALRNVDFALDEICHPRQIVYTRFADDLLFSCQSDFKDLQDALFETIERSGFRRNHRKTKYKRGPIKATGIEIRNNELALGSHFFERKEDPIRTDESREGLARYIQDVTGAVLPKHRSARLR